MANDKKETKPDFKQLLSDPKYRIELHSLVSKETDKVYAATASLNVQTMDVEGTAKLAIEDFEKVTKNLRNMMAYGCYFGTIDQEYLWTGILNRLGEDQQVAGSTFLLTLQQYPALLLLYAGGLTAIASENYSVLKAILETQNTSKAHEPAPLIIKANCTMLADAGNKLLGYERRKTPLSDHLFELFEKTLPSELYFGKNFAELFDYWEIILAMTVADVLRDRSFMGAWGPVGRFSWRNDYSESNILKSIGASLDDDKDSWPLLRAGLFDGSAARARNAHEVVQKLAERVSFF